MQQSTDPAQTTAEESTTEPEQSLPRRSGRKKTPVVPLNYDTLGGRNIVTAAEELNASTASEGAFEDAVETQEELTPTTSEQSQRASGGSSRRETRSDMSQRTDRPGGGSSAKPKGKSYTAGDVKQYLKYKTDKSRRDEEEKKKKKK